MYMRLYDLWSDQMSEACDHVLQDCGPLLELLRASLRRSTGPTGK